MIRAKSGVPLKRTHLWFWTIPVCRVFPQKPKATGWHHPGNAPNLSPYGFASLPFDKFAQKLPNIFKDRKISFVDNSVAYPPPRVSTGFTGILFIFYVVYFSNVAENVYILVFSLLYFLFL